MKKKLIIDFEPFADFEGSIFYFDNFDETFEFIKIASKNSTHSYYIQDFKSNNTDNIKGK